MPTDDIQEQIVKYLTDAHSAEEHAINALESGAEAVEDARLATVLRQHLGETKEHERLVRERLEALDANPSKLKDVAQKGAAAISGLAVGAAPDTTGKVAIQVYAFEHMEIAAYRMLRTVSERAGDHETATIAERILAQEEQAARKVGDLLEEAALVGLPQAA